MEKIYLVSVQPEAPQTPPAVYFAESAFQVDKFIMKYDHGTVCVKQIIALPDLSDGDEY